MIRSVVIGSGAVTPRTVVPNASLEERVETTSEWIVQTMIVLGYIAASSHAATRVALRL